MADAKTIGVIAPSLAGEFNVQVINGIYQCAIAQGFNVMGIEAAPQYVADHQLGYNHVAGWIFLMEATQFEAVEKANKPIVMVSPLGDPGRHHIVKPDNYDSARTLVDHVIEHGHRKIAFLGNMNNADILERYKAYEDALAANNIPLDPALIIKVDGYIPEIAEAAMRSFLQTNPDFTALVSATDHLALGVYTALEAAGKRIPEDVVVTGFDDIFQAQYLEPAMTTARQQPEDLGYRAATLLLDILDGKPPAEQINLVPTAPIIRRSCGCIQASKKLTQPPALTEEHWTEWLRDRLTQILYHPLPPPTLEDGSHSAAIDTLISNLEDVVAGRTPDDDDLLAIDSAWRVMVAQQFKADMIQAMQTSLRQAATIARQADNSAELLKDWDTRMQTSVIEASLTSQREAQNAFVRLLQANYWLSLHMASASEAGSKIDLTWMDRLQTQSSCVALWNKKAPTRITIDSVYDRNKLLGDLPGTTISAADFPPERLIMAAQSEHVSTYIICVPIVSNEHDWGILAFGHFGVEHSLIEVNSLNQWATLLSSQLERQALEDSLRSEREMLRQAFERERALASTVRELGCPLIPLMPGVLLVPLIGVIDTHRAQYITETVLTGVSQHQARYMLLDMTGVPIVDTQIAGVLLNIASAAILLGARVALIGVRPELAQSIVSLGIDMHSILSFPNLQTAITGLRLNQTR